MLAHPTLEQLHALGLHGLAKGFKELEQKSEARGLEHAEWLGLLLEYETTLRRQKRFETRARAARLRHSACVEDVDYHSARGLDRALFLKLAACDWINERRNLLITGASGLGKSWLACALARKPAGRIYPSSTIVCQAVHRSRDRPWRWTLRQASAHDLSRKTAHPRRLGTGDADPDQARDLLEIVEDRYDAGSVMITSQIPVDRWHDMIGIPTLADAILDRVIHNAYRIDLTGESLRKRRSSP